MKILTHSAFMKCHSTPEYENNGRLKHFLGLPSDEIFYDGEDFLASVHSVDYINKLRRACKNSEKFGCTPTTPETYPLACLGVGLSIQAAAETLESKKGQGIFALIRPPGHHAMPDRVPNEERIGLGFCFLSNEGITANYLARRKAKVFTLDFDLHHGNGTQTIVRNQRNIAFLSTQQKGIWPYTGKRDAGNCQNIRFPSGCTDEVYLAGLESKLLPMLKSFKPDVVMLSAGFDGYFKDFGILGPTEGFKLTTRSYERIKELFSGYKTFALLSGGYNPESIRDGVGVFTG